MEYVLSLFFDFLLINKNICCDALKFFKEVVVNKNNKVYASVFKKRNSNFFACEKVARKGKLKR